MCVVSMRVAVSSSRVLKLPLADSHIALGSGVVYGLDFTTGRSGKELTLADVSWSRAPGGARPGPALRGGGSRRRASLRQQPGGGLGLHHRRTWVSRSASLQVVLCPADPIPAVGTR